LIENFFSSPMAQITLYFSYNKTYKYMFHTVRFFHSSANFRMFFLIVYIVKLVFNVCLQFSPTIRFLDHLINGLDYLTPLHGKTLKLISRMARFVQDLVVIFKPKRVENLINDLIQAGLCFYFLTIGWKVLLSKCE
jgi:hypothetical protein